MSASTSRVLFVAEAVTLAHVGRPSALAALLNTSRYDIHLACAGRAHRFLHVPGVQLHGIDSIPADRFGARLRRGVPVYEAAEIEAYVENDLELLAELKPAIVIGDFRLSLSISARIAQVPYATITNAYWSPWSSRQGLPIPVLQWTRWVPLSLAQACFDRLQMPILSTHCRPLNEVRVRHGLKPLPNDLRHVYTDADHVWYADSPALFPTNEAPATHRHLGPILWSPPTPEGTGVGAGSGARLVYVTMGSSGDARLLKVIFDALEPLDVEVVASTAGAQFDMRMRPRVKLADYLPGPAMAALASLVICNGGSPTAQQAIAGSTPVLGLCANMDQLLNMRGVEAAELGVGLRTDRITRSALTALAGKLLARDRQAWQDRFRAAQQPDVAETFPALLGRILA